MVITPFRAWTDIFSTAPQFTFFSWVEKNNNINFCNYSIQKKKNAMGKNNRRERETEGNGKRRRLTQLMKKKKREGKKQCAKYLFRQAKREEQQYFRF